MGSITLNLNQKDALKEIINMASGTAATAISKLINENVNMEVPFVNVISFEDLIDKCAERITIATMIKITGEINGAIMLVFNEKFGKVISQKLFGGFSTDDTPLEERLDYSFFCEVNNILSAYFLRIISQLTGLDLKPSVPAITLDYLASILSTSFIEEGYYEGEVIELETVFKTDFDTAETMDFYFIPNPDSLEILIKAIGLK